MTPAQAPSPHASPRLGHRLGTPQQYRLGFFSRLTKLDGVCTPNSNPSTARKLNVVGHCPAGPHTEEEPFQPRIANFVGARRRREPFDKQLADDCSHRSTRGAEREHLSVP